MHQVMISSSDANGADLGLREAYGPLFDQYGVDLVLCVVTSTTTNAHCSSTAS